MRTSEDAGTLNAAVYPQLYALCERAERTAGYSGPLLLRIEASSDLGVERTGGRFLVHLGADALLTLAEEELCQSLLRVFSVFSDRRFRREVSYADFLERGRDAHVFAFLNSRLFRLPDMEYELRFELYQYAAAYLSVEERCPGLKAIEDPAAAASALLRARCYDYWCWEQDHSDTPARDRYEELFHYLQQERPEQFRRELPARRAFWDELIAKELSIADRPGLTLRRQPESLGVPQPEPLKAEILEKLVRIGGADLSRVYLVRKTISPTIHTSAMIVRFEEDCPVERQDEILRRLYFVLDDSTDWQFSLFDYNDVRTVPVDRIEGSLFYEKEKPQD